LEHCEINPYCSFKHNSRLFLLKFEDFVVAHMIKSVSRALKLGQLEIFIVIQEEILFRKESFLENQDEML